jgi:hypothetical protein
MARITMTMIAKPQIFIRIAEVLESVYINWYDGEREITETG